MDGVKRYSIYEFGEGEFALEQDRGRLGRPVLYIVREQDLSTLIKKGQALAHQSGCELVIEKLTLKA